MKTQQSQSVVGPLALAGLGAAVLVLSIGGVSAVLNAETQNTTPQLLDSGTLTLSMSDNGVGFSQDIQNVAPGDVINRYVNLTNTGTLDGRDLTLAVSGTGSQALITNGSTTQALTVAVSSCSVAWTVATGVCSGTSAVLLPATTISTLSSAQTLENASFSSGDLRYLQVGVSLPDQTETTVNGVFPADTIQGQSVSLVYQFGLTQRLAETSND